MDEEQIHAEDQDAPQPDHVPGTGKGEEAALKEGREAGREDLGQSHADRPAGTRTGRDATSAAGDEDPIDPSSPPMPPP
jgi:hypothetical protein